MHSINITEPYNYHDDLQAWFIATLVMLTGKIYTGIGSSKLEAIDNLKAEFNKSN